MFRAGILLIVWLSISAIALCHPGRLDSKGGHRNIAAGGYHYHSGDSDNRFENHKSPKDIGLFYGIYIAAKFYISLVLTCLLAILVFTAPFVVIFHIVEHFKAKSNDQN